MDDFRSEIRRAFEEEQAAHPPAPGTPETIARAADASTGRPRQTSSHWAAAAAAVLLGTLVVAGLLSTHLFLRPLPSRPQPSPTPAYADYGPPPAGVALIYVANPKHAGWYTGFDWGGRPRGTIKLAQPFDPPVSLVQAPDGSGFTFTPANSKGGFDQFLDRLGQPIPNQMQSFSRIQSEIWSDDSRQLCSLFYGLKGWALGLRKPGQSTAPTNAVALESPNLTSGIIAIQVATCSPASDRAVLVYSYFERPAEAWVVRISDGAILRHEIYPANQLANITSSNDGSLVAYNSNLSTGYLLGGTAPNTVIRRASDGSLVATLDPSMAVVAFSADDSRALVTTTPWASGVETHLAMVDVTTGAVIWRDDSTAELSKYLVQPDGGGFAVLMKPASDQPFPAPVQLVIVRSDGGSITVPGQHLQP